MLNHPRPIVSVIIPTHNRRESVIQAVASVLNQDVPRIEIIVVDDGSTDGTEEALRPYFDRIEYLRQDNRGVSSARNLGMNTSRGRFIALLDSDDLWRPGKVAAQLSFFQKYPHLLICQTQEIWIRGGVLVNPRPIHRKRAGQIFDISLGACMISPSAVMFRRELLSEVGYFDETLPACED
ncbi:MAG: glycosyltransferase family 2 protein, partial [Deltaproteobacteria bacterium]|nr:glycosyltransferase family 2 protein [Deltaproteobacteria bacterium]